MLTSINYFLSILLTRSLKFIIPFGVWMLLFYKIFSGQSPVGGDGFDHYVYAHYFISNLKLGIFPLWNPFLMFGVSQIFYSNFIGVFNPIWLFAFLLNLLGIKIYFAYVYAITCYFFMGTLGFYFLVKTYLKQKQYAYMAFLLLLFSSFGLPIFLDLKYLVIFVPIIWFFYFCLRFYQAQEVFSFVGLSLCVMISATCYFPPYWLTIIAITIVLNILFFPLSFFSAIKALWGFFIRHKIVFMICCFAIGASCTLSIKAFDIVKKKEIVFPYRTNGLDALSRSGPHVDLERMQGLMLSIEQFSDDYLDIGPGHLSYRDPAPFYVSLFAFIVILLGGLNTFARSIMVKCLFCMILFFIIAVPAAPVFEFLFYHLWGFSLIQGLRSFMPALIMAFIFLAVEQEKKIVEEKFFLNKKIAFGLVVLVHIGILFFLVTRSSNTFSSYATIVVSLCYFFFVFFKRNQKMILFLLLYLALLLQPLETLWRYGQNVYSGSPALFKAITYAPTTPLFSYHRPRIEANKPFDACEELWCYDIVMRDAPVPTTIRRDFPARWTYFLFKEFPLPVIEEYGRNKFYVYDKVVTSSLEDPSFIEKIFKKEINTAILYAEPDQNKKEDHDDLENLLTARQENNPQRPEVIEGPRDDFKVVSFDVNTLKIQTNFSKDKFLVYTDSYQSDWRATINKKNQKLYRANIAFKGVFLPKGSNEIVLRYAPLGGANTYVLILMIYDGMFLWLIFLLAKKFINEHRRFKERRIL